MIWKPEDYTVVTHPEGWITIIRSDGANIPFDPRNVDYFEFLQVEKEDLNGEIKRVTIQELVQYPPLEERVSSLEDVVASILESDTIV